MFGDAREATSPKWATFAVEETKFRGPVLRRQMAEILTLAVMYG